MFSEKKIDNSFLVSHFLIDGYAPPFKLDPDNNGGGIMVFVREDIPCKLLSVENHPMEGFYVGIKLRKIKWLFCCSYNANRCKIDLHLKNLSPSLALYSSHYENFIIIGDFNVEANDSAISVFSDTYDLKGLIKEPTCYKNPNKTSCIDLILTNKPRSFQHSCVIKTGLPDFHKMTVTVMKACFEKLQPTIVNYRDYKYFENDRFRTDLLPEFGKANIEEKENGLNNLINACKRILDTHASRRSTQGAIICLL